VQHDPLPKSRGEPISATSLRARKLSGLRPGNCHQYPMLVHYIRYKILIFIFILFLRVDYNDVALSELITHDDIILCLEC
jgi:hypothetical protein